MPAGDAVLTDHQHSELVRNVSNAERMSGLKFSVYIGPLADGRTSAEAMHGQLAAPSESVLVAVDPSARQLEIVTGLHARVGLTNHACNLAALSMTTSFSAGDLMGGLRDGLLVLGEQGRRPPVLHAKEF